MPWRRSEEAAMVVVRVVTATINLIMKGVDKEWEIDEAKNDLDWRYIRRN